MLSKVMELHNKELESRIDRDRLRRVKYYEDHKEHLRLCNKTWQKIHGEERAKYMANRRTNIKMELIDYMGGKCVKCGLTPNDIDGCPMVFVIDEIKPLNLKKKFNRLTKYKIDLAHKLFSEGKIQLLCFNCSMLKTWKNKDSAHRFPKM